MTRTLETSLGRSAIAVVAVLAVVIGVGWGTAGGGVPDDGPIVLVSGRDDHGLVVAGELALHDGPGGTQVATVVGDTLVRVHEVRGTWLRVSSLEGDPVEGWIDDLLTRGELHVVLPDAPACTVPTSEGGLQPSARVRVTELHVAPDGDVTVGVTPVNGEGEHHVERAWLRELPGPAAAAGGRCAWIPDVAESTHTH